MTAVDLVSTLCGGDRNSHHNSLTVSVILYDHADQKCQRITSDDMAIYNIKALSSKREQENHSSETEAEAEMAADVCGQPFASLTF